MADPFNPQVQKYVAEWMAAGDAANQGDIRSCMEHYLLGCVEVPDKHHDLRYEMFQSVVIYLSQHDASLWTGQFASLLQTRFAENEQELLLYRALAAVLLGHYSTLNSGRHQNSCPEAVAYYQRAVSFCNAATRSERRKTVRKIKKTTSGNDVCTENTMVGEMLDGIERYAQREMEYQKDRMGFMKQMMKKGNAPLARQDEVVDEVLNHLLTINASNSSPFWHQPTVTSAIMERIKQLPETDITLLIVPDTDDMALLDSPLSA